DGIGHARNGARTFADAPTIVRTSNTVVNLFPGILAHVIDVHSAAAGLKTKGVGIAQANRPNRLVEARGRAGDVRKRRRIVCRDGAIRIDAQHFPQPVSERLRVGGVGVLAHRYVELAVRTKMYGAAVVVGRAEIFQVQNSY